MLRVDNVYCAEQVHLINIGIFKISDDLRFKPLIVNNFKSLFLFFYLNFSNLYAIDSKAEQVIVMDYNTGEVLFEKNANAIVQPASLTKIMTVYVVFDRLKNSNLSINDTCLISAKAYRMGGSKTFLEIDERVTVNDLLRGIIIQSGNDASIAIAECLAGTEEDFAKLMNVYANRIGMTNTNFINSSGWPEKNHYSSVQLNGTKIVFNNDKPFQIINKNSQI